MPAIPVNSVLEWVVSYNANGQRLLNVLHWKNNTAIPDNPLDAIYNEVNAALITAGPQLLASHRGCTSQQTIYESYRFQFVFPTRFRATVFPLVATSGLRVGDCELQNIQGTIIKRTDLATRRGRGASRVGGLATIDVDQGLLTAGLITALNAFAIDLSSTFTTTTFGAFTPVVFNRPKPTLPGGSTNIVTVQVRSEARTQRSRTVGRGE